MLINGAIIPRTSKGFDGRSKGQEAAAEADGAVAQSIQNVGEWTQSFFNYGEATRNNGQSANNPQEQDLTDSEVAVPQPPAQPQEQPRTASAARVLRENQVETIV